MSTFLDAVRTPLLIGATLTTALQAGTYFAFAVGVMPGLLRTDDATFVSTMQQVNAAIVNPLFLLTFVGAPLLAVLAIAPTQGQARLCVVVGAVLAVATALVTAAGNVPLNNELAAAGPDLAAARAQFESSWVLLNTLRTVTGAGAVVALALGALRN